MRLLLAPALVLVALLPVAAQPPAKGKDPAPPGYRTHKIDGATFMVSQAVFDADASKYEKKPLDILEAECKALMKLLPPKSVELFKRLVIWVEWDKSVTLKNGRAGFALATYYGGPPQVQVAAGRLPAQAKTVTIHRLKWMTEEHQKTPPNGELLLHEFAHAVHDQLLGEEHPGIRSAYQQAMERKLYDKDLYAATNPHEYFAEITVAYLGRLDYFPKTRDDLKKHDAAGFKVAESVWGKAASKAAAEPTSVFNTTVKLPKDVRFGEQVFGPPTAADKLAGKVVVVGYWGRDNPGVLLRLDKWYDELSPYGLVVVAPYAFVRDGAELKEEAAKRGADDVAVFTMALVQDEPGTFSPPKSGHAIVFAPDGTCTHRGEIQDAEKVVRGAIAKKLLADVKMPAEPSKPLAAVVDALTTGTPMLTLIPKLAPLLTAGDDESKAAAKAIHDVILAPGTKALAEAQAAAKGDPLGAYLAAEKVAASFKGTPVGAKATAFVTTLRSNQAVAAELRARAVLVKLQAVATQLDAQPGSFDPTSPDFQAKNRGLIQQGQTLLEQMKKQHPNARSTKEAEKLVKGFGG